MAEGFPLVKRRRPKRRPGAEWHRCRNEKRWRWTETLEWIEPGGVGGWSGGGPRGLGCGGVGGVLGGGENRRPHGSARDRHPAKKVSGGTTPACMSRDSVGDLMRAARES